MAGSLLPGADSAPPELRFHGFNQYLQLFLALFQGAAVDILGTLLSDSLVDFDPRLPLHGFRHVGVDVQGGAGEPVPHHRREGLHVHAVLQRRGHEGMPQMNTSGPASPRRICLKRWF